MVSTPRPRTACTSQRLLQKEQAETQQHRKHARVSCRMRRSWHFNITLLYSASKIIRDCCRNFFWSLDDAERLAFFERLGRVKAPRNADRADVRGFRLAYVAEGVSDEDALRRGRAILLKDHLYLFVLRGMHVGPHHFREIPADVVLL